MKEKTKKVSKKVKKVEKLVLLKVMVTPEQKRFIKDIAKINNWFEAEVVREIIQNFYNSIAKKSKK